jgi:thiosulfate/3-mercaptopyruvate sulfurtransferase
MLVRSPSVLFMLVLASCGSSAPSNGLSPDGGTPDGGVPPGSSLIVDTDWLEARLGDPDMQLIDARASGYEASRILGAIHLTPAELAITVDGVPEQIAPPMQAQPVLREAGLKNDVIAVVYGGPPEYDPGRIVWSLRYYGHADVRYLDGGYTAWVAAEGAIDTDPPSIDPTQYTIVGVDERLRVTGDWVLSQLGDAPYDMPAIQLVDARSDREYAAGHIPSARSVNWTRNLSGGFLRPETELDVLYDGMDPATTTVTYCASGRRGAFDWLTLTALGYDDVRLYDGSWNEWGDPDREFPAEP